MKEKRSFKRFERVSSLAVLGVIGMLLFESIFIFELYIDAPLKWKACLPAILRPYLISSEPAAGKGGEQLVPTEAKEPAPVKTEESVPAEAENPVPVG